MVSIRKAQERGHFQNDWLNSYHSFSFGEYYDPEQMGVSILRVINDDHIAAKGGFPTHPHQNMEIVTYVLSGELAHKDSMGNGSTIRAGDVQRMSAGSGITHSEFNPSDTQSTTLLQIWLIPNQRNIQPSYEQRFFAAEEKQNRLRLLVSTDGRDDSMTAQTDALLYGCVLDNQRTVSHNLGPDRLAYVHIAKGKIKVNAHLLQAGDAATITAGTVVQLLGVDNAEILLFDLPNKVVK